jgi:hypothetical protein
MPTAIDFNHLIGWLDSADFAHCISQSFNVINARL